VPSLAPARMWVQTRPGNQRPRRGNVRRFLFVASSRAHGVDGEVVGRFVPEQQVALALEQLGEVDAVAFPA